MKSRQEESEGFFIETDSVSKNTPHEELEEVMEGWSGEAGRRDEGHPKKNYVLKSDFFHLEEDDSSSFVTSDISPKKNPVFS